MIELQTMSIVDMLTPYNFTDANNLGRVEFLVAHYFGSLGSAKQVAQYFAGAYRGASAHLQLDETKIAWRSVKEEDIAWHCGTSGTYYHPRCRNSNSIGFEIRPYIVDPAKYQDASYRGWYFGTEVEDNAVEIFKAYMKAFNVPIEKVVRHYDVTHKYCPRPWMGDDINLWYQTTGNEQWLNFKKRLEEDDMPFTQADWDKMFEDKMQRLAAAPGADWSKEARDWAIANNIIKGVGTNPDGSIVYQWAANITREQTIQILYNIAQKGGIKL